MMKTYLVFYNLNKRTGCHFSITLYAHTEAHKQEVHLFFFFFFMPETTLQETENKVVMSEGEL